MRDTSLDSPRRHLLSPPAAGGLLGRYRLGPLIASGGMASVFAARPLAATNTEKVVIKQMHPHLARSERFVAMFVAEARLCSRLDHPGIVKLHDFEATDQGLYLVLELVDGLDLRAVLKTCQRNGIRMPAKLAAFIVAHVLEALDYAHETIGVIHRDLSPSNVLVSRKGRVVVADFGIAHAASQSRDLTRDMLVGKFGYMSPEYVRGLPVDARSDLFSIGIVLAELLMCRRLFIGRSDGEVLRMVKHVKLTRFGQLGGHISEELRAIVLRALAIAPGDRYQSAAEFRDALVDWLDVSRARTGAHELAEFIGETGPL